MNKHDAEVLISTIKSLIEPSENGQGQNKPARETKPALEKKADVTPARQVEPFTKEREAPFDEEAMYQRFRARFIDDARIDPTLLHLIANQPEIIVEYERTVERVDAGTLRGRICRLIVNGYFTQPRTNSGVDKELGKTGTRPSSGTLSTTLASLVASGILVRQGDGLVQAPGIKISEQQIEAR